MPRYVVTGPARRDIDSIWRWTAENWSIDWAERLIQQFHESFQLLAENPFAGRGRPEYDANLRSFVVRNTPFIIFYFPQANSVDIVRIRHGSQNLTTMFEQ